MRKFPRILFFILASMPTAEDFDESESFGPNVAFRNASLVTGEGSLEDCDGVAGAVPKVYADKYPTARDAIEKWQTAEMQRRSDKAAGLKPSPEPELAATKAGTFPINSKPHIKGQAAAKAQIPAPAAAAGWKANS